MGKETSALIVGGGGREHQLGLSIAGSVDKVYFAPGNAGTAQIENAENLDFGPSALGNIVQFAKEKRPQLTIVGPEAPLVQGLADRIRENYSLTFGPGSDGAMLEGSKKESADFNTEFGIPQPETRVATTYERGLEIIGKDASKWVIKADALASGKGVKEPKTNEDAQSVIKGMLDGSLADGAGKDYIVFQERMHGPEVSVLVVSDGRQKMILPFSQDHKKLLDGDKGPNTGGMGAFAPVPSSIISAAQKEKIEDIAERAIYGLQKRGIDYRGVLYMGLMLAEERQGDPLVLEYNCRFGDPETQAVLTLMQQKGADVYELLRSAAEGQLKPDMYLNGLIGNFVLTNCLAAPGYPEAPVTGSIINGLDKEYPGVVIQHGGTKKEGENIVTAGGRVLYVSGIGQTPVEAAKNTYHAIGNNGINFEGMQFRTDIGHQIRTPGASA